LPPRNQHEQVIDARGDSDFDQGVPIKRPEHVVSTSSRLAGIAAYSAGGEGGPAFTQTVQSLQPDRRD
jgi:hypothetical protein